MKRSDKGRDDVQNGAEYQPRRRAPKVPRGEVLSELPLVALLLGTAVLVAALAAGGPVLDVLASMSQTGAGTIQR